MRNLVLGVAAVVLGLAAAGAVAGPREGARRGTTDLVRPAAAPDDDATGDVRVRHGRRGDRINVKVRRLEPRTAYEVRDGDTARLLGTITTDRKGRGSLALREGGRARKLADLDLGGVRWLEVVNGDTGDAVLEGDVWDEEDEWSDYAFGFADYASEAGDRASVSLVSLPPDSESIFVSFSPATGTEGWNSASYEWYADTAEGDELPLGAASAEDLAGRRFEIRDRDDTALISGVLPDLETFDEPALEDPFAVLPGLVGAGAANFDPPKKAARHRGRGRGHGRQRADATTDDPALDPAYFLFVEDDEGDLVQVAELEEVEYGGEWPGDWADGSCGGGWYVEFSWGEAGSFDLGDFGDFAEIDLFAVLESLFGGGFDWSDAGSPGDEWSFEDEWTSDDDWAFDGGSFDWFGAWR